MAEAAFFALQSNASMPGEDEEGEAAAAAATPPPFSVLKCLADLVVVVDVVLCELKSKRLEWASTSRLLSWVWCSNMRGMY